MPPKKVLVVRQKYLPDGRLSLEPVAWKDETETHCAEVEPLKSTGVEQVSEINNILEPSLTKIGGDVIDSTGQDGTDDDDFLAPVSGSTEPVEDDKMLNYSVDQISSDWISDDFGAEAIEEILGPGFAVNPPHEEKLVPELGITEPIEDASLTALNAERVMEKKKAPPAATKSSCRPAPTYPRQCEFCGLVSYTKNQYKSHRVYHHTPQNFEVDSVTGKRQCEFCEKAFAMKPAFVKHQRSVHWKELNLEEPRYPCRWCDRVYMANSSRIYHEMTIHRPKDHVCKLCGLKFKAFENLNKHLKTHNASYYRCFKCRNLFKSVNCVRKHFANKHPDLEFDERMVTMNSSADRKTVQNVVGKPTPASESATFDSVENLQEFLKENPNYQIIETTENGQVEYHLVGTSDTNEIDDVNGTLLNRNVGKNVAMSHQNVRLVSDVGGVLSQDAAVEITELGLNQVQKVLSSIPNVQGKLAYRCQSCSMVFDDTEEIMKHCLLIHQDIAQVVIV